MEKFTKPEVRAMIRYGEVLISCNRYVKYDAKCDFVNRVLEKIKGFAPFMRKKMDEMTSDDMKEALEIIKSMPLEKKRFFASFLKAIMHFSSAEINEEECRFDISIREVAALPEVSFSEACDLMEEYIGYTKFY